MTNKRMKILFLVGVLVLSVMQISSLTAFGNDEAVTISLPEETITLYPPFEVKSAVMYRDGGTIAIVIKDGKGTSFPFCLDGRVKRPSKLRYVYVGATHPDDAGAKQVPLGSAAEKSILMILKSAKIGESTPPISQDLVATVIEELGNR
ncbi:MAG: hypothetical protein A2Y65_01740 [Deltaproteobacteria bacterium RBG_13_52_11]|nr:MAG: hypothetical protein A2Y65_01740 [Deltaproteobacteria bacterium RBG_13_52_11]